MLEGLTYTSEPFLDEITFMTGAKYPVLAMFVMKMSQLAIMMVLHFTFSNLALSFW